MLFPALNAERRITGNAINRLENVSIRINTEQTLFTTETIMKSLLTLRRFKPLSSLLQITAKHTKMKVRKAR